MRTRAEQKAHTRARLLDAAALLVASRGVEGATVDAIASGAGVTTGAVYASFRTKTELLAALISERRGDTPNAPLESLAQDFGERWAAILDSDPIGAALIIELLVAAGRDEDLRAAMADQIRDNTQQLSARLAAEQLPVRLSVDDTALLLQVLAAGIVALRQVLGDELPPSLLTKAVELLRAEA